ncbi:MAG: type II toxin-antitoxin system HicB family antitoxin [Chloroflexi bacterium]|nr:type II toxin-antitoxin system HicB family antitoxin [Chloroflexota bacterium]
MNARVKHFSNLKYLTIVLLEETTAGGACYVASHPELPGCMSQGDTPEEALQDLEEARELVIEHLLNNNLPVPVPQYLLPKDSTERPVVQTGYFATKVESEYSAPPAELIRT